VIHVREADEACARVLREEGAPAAGGVIHCFTGDAAAARTYLDLGLHVSFAGVVTFRSADAVRDAARIVPRDRLLVETDCPYLAPVPHRGRRNEPAWVAETARRVAEIRGEPVEEIARATTENARRLFRLP
jgi:TatD DNase family protein